MELGTPICDATIAIDMPTQIQIDSGSSSGEVRKLLMTFYLRQSERQPENDKPRSRIAVMLRGL